MIERRNQYRAVPEEGELAATAQLDGRTYSFSVMNLTSGGTALLVPRGDDPGFEIGQAMDLAFTSAVLREPVRVRARVVHVQDEVVFSVCGLAFSFAPHGEVSIPTDLRTLFNRRRCIRVDPDSAIRVTVNRHSTGETIDTVLNDVSESGIAFRTEAPLRCDIGEFMDFAFSLPTGHEPLELVGMLRHLETDGDASVCGAEFDHVATRNFEEQRLVLVAYVVQRRQEPASTT